ncbi:Uncharacterised protein [Mycobacteroides abscessus subsp. abscessus]|nr:Uncharacterised protein [Mycobacteroides abscessus subsp. abscessus]
MFVQRHGHHVELGRKRAHGDRVESVSVGKTDGTAEYAIPVERNSLS